MLTYLAGWRTRERDELLLTLRDRQRQGVFFIDNRSALPDLLPRTPIIDLYRTGPMQFEVDDAPETLIRVNHDTDDDLLFRAIAHTLLRGTDAQLVVTFDALDTLYRLFPALRAANAILVADERLDPAAGDHVLFTRGGSFSWRDYLVEERTALLANTELFDAGIVPDECADPG